MKNLKVEFINQNGKMLATHNLIDDTTKNYANFDWGTMKLIDNITAKLSKSDYTVEHLNDTKSIITIELSESNQQDILANFYGNLILLALKFKVQLLTANFNIYQ